MIWFHSFKQREMKVKIKQWHGVASWLWVANDENCGICRAPFNGCCPDCRATFPLFLYCFDQNGVNTADSVRYWNGVCIPAVCVTGVCVCARVQVKSPETTALWSGVSAHTASTCTASWSGWTRSRCSSSAPCAGRSGSLKSEALTVRLLFHFDSLNVTPF